MTRSQKAESLPSPGNVDLARMLRRKAASDEIVFRRLVDDPDIPDDVLGFHLQQAVEKLVKAVLAGRAFRSSGRTTSPTCYRSSNPPTPRHRRDAIKLSP